MENFIKCFEKSVKSCWNLPALSLFQVKDENYSDLAEHIELLQITWKNVGLVKGDKISLNAKSSINWVEVFFGAITAGYTTVQIYNAFLPADAQKLVAHSDSRILYTEKNAFAKMDFEQMPELLAAIDTETLEVLASRGDFAARYAEAKAIYSQRHPNGMTPDDVKYEDVPFDSVCAIMYTSGSTGNPKGVMLSVKNISWNVDTLPYYFPYQPGDAYVSILPYAHIFGLVCDAVVPLCCGMHAVILGKMPIPANVEQAMRAYSPKIFLAVPLVLSKFVEYTCGAEMKSEEGRAKLEDYKNNKEYCTALRAKVLEALGGNLEIFATGGAAIPPEIEKLLAFQIEMPFVTGYGMTETAPLIGCGKVGHYKAKSCGEASINMEARIDSPDQENIPGELQINGDNVFVGYYKNPEATKAAFTEDGWFRTGDICTIDSDRNIFICGRCKNMLLSTNGQNVYPEEVEVLLNALPYVAESLLVQRGSQFHAIIVPNANAVEAANIDAATLNAIMDGNIKNLNTKLPAYSAVSSFEVRVEPFAKTPKGTIKRFMYV